MPEMYVCALSPLGQLAAYVAVGVAGLLAGYGAHRAIDESRQRVHRPPVETPPPRIIAANDTIPPRLPEDW